MSTFKKIGEMTPTAASVATYTSWFAVPQEAYDFCVMVPGNMCNTATAQVRWQGCQTQTGGTVGGSTEAAAYDIVYGNFESPANSGTSGAIYMTELPMLNGTSGAIMPANAFKYAPYIRAWFTRTTTANTSIKVYARMGIG